MVMRSLFAKTLYDARKSLLGWILGLVAAAGLVLVMYPVVRTGSYQETLENSPETLLSAFGMDRDMDLTMGSGYLTAYLFGMMVPLLLMVFAISHGARLVAGEEDRGTLDLLAALPVPGAAGQGRRTTGDSRPARRRAGTHGDRRRAPRGSAGGNRRVGCRGAQPGAARRAVRSARPRVGCSHRPARSGDRRLDSSRRRRVLGPLARRETQGGRGLFVFRFARL